MTFEVERSVVEIIRKKISSMKDNRVTGRCTYRLFDVIAMTLCGVLAGCEGWDAISLNARDHEAWFSELLQLEHGVPHADTFRRVFERLDPEEFGELLMAVADGLRKASGVEGPEIISIDGKSLRRSFDKALGQKNLHIVSAYEGASGFTLAQLATDAKSNEITAIPKLLDKLDVTGAVVTLDAMGCQTAIVDKITEKSADYVISLKGNQGTLHDQVKNYFSEASMEYLQGLTHASVLHTVEKAHGRIEERSYVIVNDTEVITGKTSWTNLQCIGMVISRRTIGDKVSEERRHFIASIPPDVELFERAVRGHWLIENGSHFVLDVTFSEDQSRIRRDNSPENMAVMRRLANGLLKNENSVQRSIKQKILKVNRDTNYLKSVLRSQTH